MFVDDTKIRIIMYNSLDCLFDISRTSFDAENDKAQLDLISYTKLDNYKLVNFNEENHTILEKKPQLAK